MTPRRKSWFALVVFALAVLLAANLPLEVGRFVVLLSFIGYGVFQATLRCPRCRGLLVRRQVAGITMYVPLAPHSCAKCGLGLDSPASGAEAQTSDEPHA